MSGPKTMASGGSNGEMLMLEAPPEHARPWGSNSNAELVDALPYIDDDYSHPKVKVEVDRLVEEEMRRSTKKPVDFLKDLPPFPKTNFEDHPMIAKEYARVRAGKPPVSIDFFSRYKIEPPPVSKESDVSAWSQALQRAQRWSQYQVTSLENLELLLKYGPDVWRQSNQRLEAHLSRMQKLAKEQNENIEAVNRQRKFHQQKTAYELNALTAQWNELCQKNIDIQTACAQVENHIEALRREATERGLNLDAQIGNDDVLHN